MKDWLQLFADQTPTISYDPERLLEEIKPGYDADDAGELSDEEYELIRRDLQSLTTSGLVSVEFEEPESEGKAAGGGEELIWIVIAAAVAFFSAYPGAKEFAGDVRDKLPEVAADIRRIVERVRSRGRTWISIPQKGAIICGWAYASELGEDVAFEYVAPIERPNDYAGTYVVGWLVTFTVDGRPLSVVVARNGEVVGTVSAPDVALVVKLAQDLSG